MQTPSIVSVRGSYTAAAPFSVGAGSALFYIVNNKSATDSLFVRANANDYVRIPPSGEAAVEDGIPIVTLQFYHNGTPRTGSQLQANVVVTASITRH